MGAVEGEQFITKLALDILDGRSFDINGRKCTYEQLFAEVEFAEVEERADELHDTSTPPEGDIPVAGPSKEVAAKPDLQVREKKPAAVQKSPPKAGPSKAAALQKVLDAGNAPVDVQKVLLKNLDTEYKRLLKTQLQNVKRFKESKIQKGQESLTRIQKHIYRTKMRSKIDTFSKSILLSIQQLQNQFQDVGRLKRVTDNLELLSQAINFDDL